MYVGENPPAGYAGSYAFNKAERAWLRRGENGIWMQIGEPDNAFAPERAEFVTRINQLSEERNGFMQALDIAGNSLIELTMRMEEAGMDGEITGYAKAMAFHTMGLRWDFVPNELKEILLKRAGEELDTLEGVRANMVAVNRAEEAE